MDDGTCRGTLELHRPSVQLVGVESEPTHFRWMNRHLRDNGIDLTAATPIQAAVAPEDGTTWFHVGAAADWYGQSIAEPPSQDQPRTGVQERLRRLCGAARRQVPRGLSRVCPLSASAPS
jgi:hypothetical protein